MAIDFRSAHPITDQELMRISRENPGMRFERSAHGELIVAPPTGMLGNFGEFELARQLDLWAKRDGRGRIISSSAGLTLPDGSIVSPDAAWISYERLDALSEEESKGFAHIAPDVVFELLSPSDTLREMRVKASKYLANQTRLVVLLDPPSQLVECHRPAGAVETHVGSRKVSLEPELPGFRLDASAVFGAMRKRRAPSTPPAPL